MITSIIIFLVMMTTVIFLHEGGHFLMAKIFNIYTKSFSIGFGPILFKKKFKETEFQIRAIPLGGMVEIPMEYTSDDIPEGVSLNRLYVNKKPYQRFLVAFAGPAVNLLIAYLVFSIIVSFVGIPPTTVDYVYSSSPSSHILLKGDRILSIDGKKLYSPNELSYFLKSSNSTTFHALVLRKNKLLHLTLHSTYTVPKAHLIIAGNIRDVNTINSAGPTHYEYNNQSIVWINGQKYKIYSYYSTEKRKVIGIILRTFLPIAKNSTINIKSGDKFLKIGNVNIDSSYKLQNSIYKYFGYKDGKIYTDITISNNSVSSTLVGGYKEVPVVVLRNGNKVVTKLTNQDINALVLTPIPYIKLNFFDGIPMTNQFFKLSITTLFSKQGVKNISGPVGIAYIIYENRNAGFMALLNLFALISLGLAIFNLLPIPPLDGSRMAYSLFEIISRKRINAKIQMIVDNTGVILLILFVVFFTYNDILRFFK